MKIQDLKVKTEKELSDTLLTLKKEQMNSRFQRATGELKNVARFRIIRKTIARIKTLLNNNKKS
jgi:large subunit ribosomal protein L29